MKRVISISLGSSKRDHVVQTRILGEDFLIERRGTDGCKKKAYQLFTELDGQYDAFGIGGIDLYIYTSKNKYTFRDAKKLIKDVRYTPAVDGSGLKNTLERMVIEYLEEKLDMDFWNKRVLMVAAVDRFGMAETFASLRADTVFGDLIFGLGIPIGIKSLKNLHRIASVVAPIITLAPIEWVYPTGSKQEISARLKERYRKYYLEADVIAGDFLFIKRYMPDYLEGKIIITNTVTADNIKELEQKGVRLLITTTPELNGRSFGTNVMEAVLVALSGVKDRQLRQEEYVELLRKIKFAPRVIDFAGSTGTQEYV